MKDNIFITNICNTFRVRFEWPMTIVRLIGTTRDHKWYQEREKKKKKIYFTIAWGDIFKLYMLCFYYSNTIKTWERERKMVEDAAPWLVIGYFIYIHINLAYVLLSYAQRKIKSWRIIIEDERNRKTHMKRTNI